MYYVYVNDINIAVYDLNPSAKKTVLFIHGWPLGHKIFEYQTNILPKLGYRTVSIDLRVLVNLMQHQEDILIAN